MKSPQRLLLLGLLAGGGVTCALVFKEQAPPALAAPIARPAHASVALSQVPESTPAVASITEPSAPLEHPAQLPAEPATPQPAAEKAPPVDPIAREALAYVGSDPDAEDYWLSAINDPRLPEGERQDLIEDLNQDGLSDPKKPTLDDLPLIENRIALIEELGWDAMDQTNAAAFQEAYNDLIDLAIGVWRSLPE
jgi:hypothetical protein